MEKLMFLQVDYDNLPAGTPLVVAEKSSAHYQATSMLGGTQVPTGYYKVVGEVGPATLAIPHLEGIVGNVHPTDPRVVGPFIYKEMKEVGEDKLPPEYFAYATVGYDYPYAVINLCVNTELGGDVLRVSLPKYTVVGFKEEVEKYAHDHEMEIEYKDYGTY